MSLTPRRRLTAKKLAANRANGPHSRGPMTPEGKARRAAANLRHGCYSKAAEVALTALGEDPAEFKRRLDSLINTYEPANALETSLVAQLARALWRMERFNRVQESLAVKHLERAREIKKYEQAMKCLPLREKLQRLKDLFAATCMDLEPSVGPEELKVFEKCRGDLSEKTAKETLRLLLRLRKPGMTGEVVPSTGLLAGAAEVAVAQGEERIAVGRELTRVLGVVIESLETRLLEHYERPDEAGAQIDRDEMLAWGQAKATLTIRGEEASLRQVWRITNLLMRIKKSAKTQKDVRNED